jgi:hypothetical protein
MKDPRRAPFALYLRELADLIGLRDWTIRLEDVAPSNPDVTAAISCIYGRRLAHIRLSDSFLDDGPEEQRATCIHELLHCHFDPASEIALESLPEAVQPSFRRMFEYGIDATAYGCAHGFPLPPKVES